MREHQFLRCTITSGEAKDCQLELTSEPGIAVNWSKVPIQTRVKGLIQSSDAFQFSHQVTQLPDRAPERTHPAPPLQTKPLPKMAADVAVRKDGHLAAG